MMWSRAWTSAIWSDPRSSLSSATPSQDWTSSGAPAGRRHSSCFLLFLVLVFFLICALLLYVVLLVLLFLQFCSCYSPCSSCNVCFVCDCFSSSCSSCNVSSSCDYVCPFAMLCLFVIIRPLLAVCPFDLLLFLHCLFLLLLLLFLLFLVFFLLLFW